MSKKNVCLVCGYLSLEEPPYDAGGSPSYEICPCCGFEFGFDDGSEGLSYDQYRENWIKGGAHWFTLSLKPANWNLEKQLKNIKKHP